MSANGWLQFVVYSTVLCLTVKPVGIYLARVLEGQRTWLDPILRPVERLTYKICGVNADREMNWREYAFAMLGFSAVTMLLTYVIERAQALLPWNPQHLPNIGADLAWNTAASFTTIRKPTLFPTPTPGSLTPLPTYAFTAPDAVSVFVDAGLGLAS